MGRDAKTTAWEVKKKLSERSPQLQTRLWQIRREDSAGDNETCSRSPTDLRGSPGVFASLPVAALWSYDSLAKGGL